MATVTGTWTRKPLKWSTLGSLGFSLTNFEMRKAKATNALLWRQLPKATFESPAMNAKKTQLLWHVAKVVHVVVANVVYVYKCLMCNLLRHISLGTAGLIRLSQKPTTQLWFSLVTFWNAFGLKVTQICRAFEIAEVDNHCWHQLWGVQNRNCVPLPMQETYNCHQHVLDMLDILDKQKLWPADLSRLVVKAFHSPKSLCCFCFKPNKTGCPWRVWPYRYGFVFTHEHHKRVCERNWIRVSTRNLLVSVPGSKHWKFCSYAKLCQNGEYSSAYSCELHYASRDFLHSAFAWQSGVMLISSPEIQVQFKQNRKCKEFTRSSLISLSSRVEMSTTRRRLSSVHLRLDIFRLDSSIHLWRPRDQIFPIFQTGQKSTSEKRCVEDSKAFDLWYFCDTLLEQE